MYHLHYCIWLKPDSATVFQHMRHVLRLSYSQQPLFPTKYEQGAMHTYEEPCILYISCDDQCRLGLIHIQCSDNMLVGLVVCLRSVTILFFIRLQHTYEHCFGSETLCSFEQPNRSRPIAPANIAPSHTAKTARTCETHLKPWFLGQ